MLSVLPCSVLGASPCGACVHASRTLCRARTIVPPLTIGWFARKAPDYLTLFFLFFALIDTARGNRNLSLARAARERPNTNLKHQRSERVSDWRGGQKVKTTATANVQTHVTRRRTTASHLSFSRHRQLSDTGELSHLAC